jgi:hypothetical protein
MLRCYEQEKSRVQLVARKSSTSKGVYKEAVEAMALEAITRQLVKTQQTEETYCVL